MDTNCKSAWELQLDMWELARSENRDYTPDELALIETIYEAEREK